MKSSVSIRVHQWLKTKSQQIAANFVHGYCAGNYQGIPDDIWNMWAVDEEYTLFEDYVAGDEAEIKARMVYAFQEEKTEQGEGGNSE